MTNMSDMTKRSWQRKFIPIVFLWILFVVVNGTLNKAPQSRGDVTATPAIFFFGPLFIALYFTFAFILGNRRRGILGALFICGLLLLRLLNLTNPMNVLLLCAFVGFVEWYFNKHPNRFI